MCYTPDDPTCICQLHCCDILYNGPLSVRYPGDKIKASTLSADSICSPQSAGTHVRDNKSTKQDKIKASTLSAVSICSPQSAGTHVRDGK